MHASMFNSDMTQSLSCSDIMQLALLHISTSSLLNLLSVSIFVLIYTNEETISLRSLVKSLTILQCIT